MPRLDQRACTCVPWCARRLGECDHTNAKRGAAFCDPKGGARLGLAGPIGARKRKGEKGMVGIHAWERQQTLSGKSGKRDTTHQKTEEQQSEKEAKHA